MQLVKRRSWTALVRVIMRSTRCQIVDWHVQCDRSFRLPTKATHNADPCRIFSAFCPLSDQKLLPVAVHIAMHLHGSCTSSDIHFESLLCRHKPCSRPRGARSSHFWPAVRCSALALAVLTTAALRFVTSADITLQRCPRSVASAVHQEGA